MAKNLSDAEVEDLKTRFFVYRSIDKRHRRIRRNQQFRLVFLLTLLAITMGYGMVEYFIFQTYKIEDKKQQKKAAVFLPQCEKTFEMIVDSSEKLLEMGEGYSNIWINAMILERDVGREMAEETSRLSHNDQWPQMAYLKDQIDHQMALMSNPPSGCEVYYSGLHHLYRLYVSVYDTVKNPGGTREAYQENLNRLSENLDAKAEEFRELLDELKKSQGRTEDSVNTQ